jgi:hypothetical protein
MAAVTNKTYQQSGGGGIAATEVKRISTARITEIVSHPDRIFDDVRTVPIIIRL